MVILNLKRCGGKSTHCIQRSYATGYPILCVNQTNKKNLMGMSERLGLSIPEPITVAEFQEKKKHGDGILLTHVIVDEMSYVLERLLGVNIDTATLTLRENIDEKPHF